MARPSFGTTTLNASCTSLSCIAAAAHASHALLALFSLATPHTVWYCLHPENVTDLQKHSIECCSMCCTKDGGQPELLLSMRPIQHADYSGWRVSYTLCLCGHNQNPTMHKKSYELPKELDRLSDIPLATDSHVTIEDAITTSATCWLASFTNRFLSLTRLISCPSCQIPRGSRPGSRPTSQTWNPGRRHRHLRIHPAQKSRRHGPC